MSINHIGTKINGFEILDFKRERQKGGYYYQYYLIKCPYCAKEKWMLRGTVENPVVISCGCQRKKFLRDSANVKGKKFGILTALHPTGEGGNYGKELWLCKCECGNTIKVTPNYLNWGFVTHCGCLSIGISGHKYITRKKNKWQARPFVDGKHVYLGVFEKLEDAVQACKDMTRGSGLSSKNTSGYTGVARAGNKWRAYIGYQKKRINLGSFDNIEDAIAARKDAEKKYYSK